ncbi:MAG: hypothetical protein JWO76_2234 [Nocardioides sp.]|nr:hypothetical protein [Nocardioides sp.]
MKLSDLVDQLELPETEVAEGIWEAARRRTRRRRTVAVGVGATLVLVVGVSALSLRGEPERPRPAGPDPTSTVTPTRYAREIDHSNTQRLLTPDLWARLDAVPALDPGATTELADDPMTRGVFATVEGDDPAVPVVLGVDGRWRRVSVPGLGLISDGRYTSPPIRPTEFSPDGTRLALPQPDSLVVVDLTDGSHRTYPMPGRFLSFAIWVDVSHVLVASEADTTGTVVDLDTRDAYPSRFGPNTAFTDDGALTWGGDRLLDWDSRPDVPTPANNGGGLNPYPPLVRDGIAVGDMAVGSRELGSEDPPLGDGVVAVDATTGDVLAYLPTGPGPGLAVLLGWQGDLPVLGLLDRTGEHSTMVIAAWDYRAGRLEPLAQTSGRVVAWNGPLG